MNARDALHLISKLDRLVVQHEDLSNAYYGINECILKTEFYKESVGSLLIAEGGMGKTTTCRAIMSQMKGTIKNTETYQVTTVPAFYAEIPSPASVKTVAASMLTQLNDPNPLIGNTAQLTTRLCNLLKKCETKLVFLDELHNLLDTNKTTTKINRNVCNWIKSIVNNTSVSFCLVGLPEFAPILSIDSQLSRRFPFNYKLNKLTPGTQENPGTLAKFLEEVFIQALQVIKLESMPNINNQHTINQVYAATSGNPSFIMSLIKESIYCSLTAGSSAVDIDHFASAWDTGVTAKSTITKNNPFRMSPGELAGYFRET
jgi:hypothetical protein